MADNNQTRRDDFGFAENDPFAELTRIMGHDPRGEAGSAAQQASAVSPTAVERDPFAGDFDIDLEKELMGDFEFDEFDQPQAPVELTSSSPQSYAAPEPVSARYETSYSDQSTAYQQAAYAPTVEPEPDHAPSAYEPAPADSRDEIDLRVEELLEAEFEAFNLPSEVEDFAPEEPTFSIEAQAAAYHEPQVAEPESYREPEVVVADVSPQLESYSDDQVEAEIDLDADLGLALAAEMNVAAEPAYEVEPDYAAEPAMAAQSWDAVAAVEETSAPAWEPDPVEAVATQPLSEQPEPATGEFDLDAELARALQGEMTSAEPTYEVAPVAEAETVAWQEEPVAEIEASTWEPEPVVAPVPVEEPDTLEDELAALLAEDSIIPAVRTEPAFSAPTNTYGRANFISPRAEEPYREAVDAPAPAFEPVNEPVVEAVEDVEPFALDESDFDFDLPAMEEPEPVGEPISFEPVPVPAESHVEPEVETSLDDEFANFFEADFELDLGEVSEPEPAFSYAASEVTPSYTTATSASWSSSADQRDTAAASGSAYPAAASAPSAFPELQPEQPTMSAAASYAAFPAHAVTREEMPEIETVDVVEAVQPLFDDLEIPEADYGDEEPLLFDDLESEISQAFGGHAADPAAEEPASWSAAAVPAAAAAVTAAAASHAYAGGSGSNSFADQQQDDATQDSGQWTPNTALADDGFDYETDLEQAIGMASYEDRASPPSHRRGVMIAAAVLGVAVVGGAGLYAMSLFGGGSDSPAIVRADNDPMKVRPENPGGATVPNQDSQVYQRVTEGGPTAAPGQERLIANTEEPIDVTAQVEDAEILPPSFSSGVDGEDAIEGLAKSEDRILPEAEPGVAGTPEDLAAVAPRRVRTMVVRPDGTMVPREEIAPEVSEPAVQQPQETVLGQPTTPVPPLGEVPGMDQAASQDDGPVVNTPESVSVVPTPRVAPQTSVAQAPAAAPAPAPVQQQAPATPVSAPAAAAPVSGATSEWSMQVASQPTAEGAQAAYQDLARRYGSVLQGRGVNIVRADIQGMGTYYRVRIPAASRDEAIQLCTRYKSAGGSCFVSR